jgi:hypothetical protein
LAKRPSSSPGSHPGQRQGARAAAARRPPGHGCGRRVGEKKEGDEGVLLPPSPWARARCGVDSTWGGSGDGLAAVARCGRAAKQWRGSGGLVVRQGRGGAIYSRDEAVRGKIFVLTGAPARSRRPAGIPAAGDGIARADRQDGSGGDGMARAEVVEGRNISRWPAAVRRGGGPRRPAPGEVMARRRSGR